MKKVGPMARSVAKVGMALARYPAEMENLPYLPPAADAARSEFIRACNVRHEALLGLRLATAANQLHRSPQTAEALRNASHEVEVARVAFDNAFTTLHNLLGK